MHLLSADSSSLSTFDIRHSTFVYPTDTCYGIGCSALDETALKRLYQAKGRDFAKPVNLMVDSLDMMEHFGQLSPTALKLAQAFLPGGFTLLLPRKPTLPQFVNPGQGFIGLRIPDHPFCLSLVQTLNTPVVTTSANVAGQPETYSLSDILEAFGEKNENIDLIFDGGEIPRNPPSTIVKVVGDSWEIVRQGKVTQENIEKALE